MIDLKNVIERYPDSLSSAKKLKAYMLDLYPNEKAKINIIVSIYASGICSQITQSTELSEVIVLNFARRLEKDYGYSKELAKECLQIWINAICPEKMSQFIVESAEIDYEEKELDTFSLTINDDEGNYTEGISLTHDQLRAVNSSSKRIAVIAGPGSGKTRVLTERIVSLVTKNGVNEKQILALSFSSKAAREMKRRLKDRLNDRYYKIEVKTFHSFGLQIIRNNFDLLGLNEELDILSSTRKYQVLRKLLNEEQVGAYAQAISKIKNGENISDTKMADICNKYNEEIHKANSIDFDDMVTMAVQLLKEHPEIRKNYQNIYLHILVDEAQDLNNNQTEMIDLLIGKETSLFVVGDDDQCIYEWRGAEPDFFKQISNNASFDVIKLEDNFRSEKNIVDLSSSLIKNNINRIFKNIKSGRSTKKTKKALTVTASSTQAKRLRDKNVEACYIADEIQSLVDKTYNYSDIAILVRSAQQGYDISAALSRRNIPFYEQLSDDSTYDEMIPILFAITNIKAKNAVNRAVNFPTRIMDNFLYMDLQEEFNIDTSLSVYETFEILASNNRDFDGCDIFRARFNLLKRLYCDYENMSAHAVLLEMYDLYSAESCANKKQAKERLGHLKTLIEIAKDFDKEYVVSKPTKKQFNDFIDFLTVSSQDDSAEKTDTEGVNLMTCHKSKGLEFPVVFIPGVQVGVFPNDYFVRSESDLEAERRLFYVSMTRAIEKLYLTCYQNPFEGKGYVKKGFLAEIPGININI